MRSNHQKSIKYYPNWNPVWNPKSNNNLNINYYLQWFKCIYLESLRLRHHILIIPVVVISGAIPAQDQGFTTALCD